MPLPPMPRRKENQAGLDFDIHQDPSELSSPGNDVDDSSNNEKGEQRPRQEDGTDDSLLIRHDDNDDDDDYKSPIIPTDSDMARASTLVGSQRDNESDVGRGRNAGKNVETAIDSMLQELKVGTDRVDERDAYSVHHRHSSPSRDPRQGDDSSCISRRESSVTSGTRGYGTEDYGDYGTEESASRRQSAASGNTYDSSSRRESSYSGTRGAESTLDHWTEEEHSFTDEGSHASVSRRESGLCYGTEADSSVVDQEDGLSSRRQSEVSDGYRPEGRTSMRTEALIHAAARGIVEQINDSHRPESSHAEEATGTPVPESDKPSTRPSDAHESLADESIRESIENDDYNGAPATEDGGDSSSHHENDDVFSEHSPRSSVGSVSEEEQKKLDNNSVAERTRSRRTSDVSHYEYASTDDGIFVPTVRGTPRPPFRSPSSVKAIQMSSPTPSRLASSRSSRRTPLPTVSRLGSPSVSAQYSHRKTPPRFKRNNTPPLVLLHATTLPLRWPWGDVLDSCHRSELSEGAKNLRDAWRLLQDRMGDTVCERGILLPHPQNDFEVLEERLLEALELPLRRRARILECGHYLGPSNDLSLVDDAESEDDDYLYSEGTLPSRRGAARETHWCTTCRSEIRYDSLGAGKVFRAKVYASNGLVKAGAWEACWREMERVDVELEPIVETNVHEELVRLSAEQLHHRDIGGNDGEEEGEEEAVGDASYFENEGTEIHHLASYPPPEVRIHASPTPPRLSAEAERRMRDEERLREIYGSTPPSHATASPGLGPGPASPSPYRTPPSPSVEAYARRKERRQRAYRNDSLPELLLEALRVMLQDRKNVVIALMSVLVLALAMRGGGGSSSNGLHQTPAPPSHHAVDFGAAVMGENRVTTTVAVTPDAAGPTAAASSAVQGTANPCETVGSAARAAVEVSGPETVAEAVETVVETVSAAGAGETETATPVKAGEDAAESSMPPVHDSEEHVAEAATASVEEAEEDVAESSVPPLDDGEEHVVEAAAPSVVDAEEGPVESPMPSMAGADVDEVAADVTEEVEEPAESSAAEGSAVEEAEVDEPAEKEEAVEREEPVKREKLVEREL